MRNITIQVSFRQYILRSYVIELFLAIVWIADGMFCQPHNIHIRLSEYYLSSNKKYFYCLMRCSRR